MATRTVAPELYEREVETERLDARIRALAGGTGGLVILEGEAGIGKSRLLSWARQRAREAGIRVLTARANEVEREYPFGVVLGLFDPLLAAMPSAQREELLSGACTPAREVFGMGAGSMDAGTGSDSSFATLRALYWLVVALAGAEPLMIAIDDVHWADAPALRWLAHLSGRVEGLAVLVVLAARPLQQGPHHDLIAAVLTGGDREVLRPRPLSAGAVGELLETALDEAPAPAFTAACLAATGGNPFFLGELADTLRAQHLSPTADHAVRVAEIGPAGVSRAVLARLAALSAQSVAFARAVAVLGDDADIAAAAALAGIELAAAGDAADALARASVLVNRRPLQFTHPIVRAAILADLPASARAHAHATAARLLAARGAGDASVAAHLVACDPSGDGWAVQRLRSAAERALAQGAPDAAITYLRRALAEPPPAAERGRLLAALGFAEARGVAADAPAAIEHLREAIALAQDPADRARTAILLAEVLLLRDEATEAAGALVDAARGLPASEIRLARELQATLLMVGAGSHRARELAGEAAIAAPEFHEPPEAPEDRLAAAIAAMKAFQDGAPASEITRCARASLDHGRLLAEHPSDTVLFYQPALLLLFADDVDEVGRVFDAAVADARARGSIRGFAMACSFRAAASLRRGAVNDAEADARAGLEGAATVGLHVGVPLAATFLIEALVERGQLDEARLLCELAGRRNATFWTAWTSVALARLHAAENRAHEDVDLLTRCGHELESWGLGRSVLLPWRSLLATALAAAGEHGRARELVAQEIEDALRFGAARPLGIALRAAALLADGAQQRAGLEEALRVLEQSPARLEHARVLVDLGAHLRRHGSRVSARECLNDGLALARRCGATALAARAHDELSATGSRPRKMLVLGVDALTPSERRIAQMAASGMSNRDIAQALFVTPRTVEVHLSHAYTKLDVRSRTELPSALT